MLDLALVTANFGGIDDVKPLPQNTSFDSFYYTDEVTLAGASAEVCATWTRVIAPPYPRRDLVPRLRAKYFKCQLHRLPETQRYRWLAWADSKFHFRDTSFLAEGVERLQGMPPSSRLMLRRHPRRPTVRSEYQYVVREMQKGNQYVLTRYHTEPMDEQIAFYETQGWNTAARLWSCGLWLIENNAAIRACWDTWWDHNIKFSIQDQLSLPIALENHNLDPQEFRFSHSGDSYFQRVQHAKSV